MANPRMLLLDEPSMGLAPVLVDGIFDTIRRLHAAGTTILLVEQNARMALQVASRGYVLHSGAIIFSDSAASLADNEMVRKAYLGENSGGIPGFRANRQALANRSLTPAERSNSKHETRNPKQARNSNFQ